MSYLVRPRASFQGYFSFNAPTANNDRVVDNFDVETVTIKDTTLSDEEYRVWMMSTRTVPNSLGGFNRWLNGYFNYFGDDSFTWDQRSPSGEVTNKTQIVSSQLEDGEIRVSKNYPDPFLDATIELFGNGFLDNPDNPKMVDLNPVGQFGTQIFSGEMLISSQVNGEQVSLLQAKLPSRAYIRWLTDARNLAPNKGRTEPLDYPRWGPAHGSAVWQMAISNDNLTWNETIESTTITKLKSAAEANNGLLVIYTIYYDVNGISEGDLADKFAAANYQETIENWSTGVITGSIGIWTDEDVLVTMPIGRTLYSPMLLTGAETVSGTPQIVPTKVETQVVKNSSSLPQVYPIAAKIDTKYKIITLEMINAISETDALLTKFDYGNLTISTIYGGKEYPVATLSYEKYNRESYQLNGGIVEVPYRSEMEIAILDGQLCISSDVTGTKQTILEELTFGAVETDDRCVYVQENEMGSVNVRVLVKGVPVTAPTKIILQQYSLVVTPDSGGPHKLPAKPLVSVDNNDLIVSYQNAQQDEDDNWYIMSDATGRATLKVQGRRAGCAMVRYVTPDNNIDLGDEYANFGYSYYSNIRVMPEDDYSNIPDNEITWDFVYNEVIRYYYLLYPGMFARLAFNEEGIARANAGIIKTLTSARQWNYSAYMPVTREMSDGKRKLLHRWASMNE